MATEQQIGALNAMVTANAQQFIAEFQRAHDTAASKGAAIDREVEQMMSRVEHHFSQARLATDFMRGFGIGSGFEIAQKSSELIASYWKNAAESAKEIEKLSEDQLKATEALIKFHETDSQALAKHEAHYANLTRQQMELAGSFGGMDKMPGFRGVNAAGASPEEVRKQMMAIGAEIAKEQLAIEELKKKAHDKEIADDFQLAEEKRALLQKEVESGNKIFMEGEKRKRDEARKAKEADEKLDDELWRAKREQLQQYLDSSARIFNEAQRKKMEEEQAAQRASQRNIEHIARESSDRISQAMVDSLNGSKDAWRNLASTAIQEMEKMIIEMEIIKPIMAALGFLGGGTAGASSTGGAGIIAGAKASGGPVDSGSTYLVGENGPEMFTPGSNGTIIPNSALAGTGGGGDTHFNFHQSFGSGVTKQDLASMMPELIRQSKMAVADMIRRGGAYQQTFAKA